MPRTIEGIVEAHHAADERRRQGRPIWDHRINLADVFHSDTLTFEQRRDAIVRRLRASAWIRDADGSLVDLVDELADAQTIGEFDGPWDLIYDYADGDRVWIATF